MKPSTPFLEHLLKDGLTINTRSKLARRQNAVGDVAPVINERGHQIFIYNNIRTNQIIYSFTRTLNVRDSDTLDQGFI